MLINWALAAYLTSSVSSATTLHHALDHHHARLVLLTSNPWVNDGLLLSAAGLESYMLKRWSRDHPKAVLGLTLTLAVTHGYATFVASRFR